MSGSFDSSFDSSFDIVFESAPEIADTNIQKLLQAAMLGVQDVEAMMNQLIAQRDIGSAVGHQLDVIAKIVGQTPRNGLDDEAFRRYVRARVAAHKSRGNTEDVIRVLDLVVFEDNAVIKVTNEGPATLRASIDGVAIPDDVAAVVSSFLSDSKSAGVRGVLEYSTFADDLRFRLDTPGRGLDAGLLTTAVDA